MVFDFLAVHFINLAKELADILQDKKAVRVTIELQNSEKVHILHLLLFFPSFNLVFFLVHMQYS